MTAEECRALTYAILAHYGYTPDEIAEAESVHPGVACGDECWTEEQLSTHGTAHTELCTTAAIVVDVVEPWLANREAVS